MEQRLKLTNELSEYIIDNYEEKLLKKIIASDYSHFLPYEQEEIYKLALKNKPECKYLIEEKIKEYLKYNDTIIEYQNCNDTVIVDGFVNFRLKDYKVILSCAVDDSVQEFSVKREYNTFITLLKYFVDLQLPLYDVANLIAGENGKVSILDDKGNIIAPDCNGDLLLDTIINIAPKKIHIHRMEYLKAEEVINTIMNVFSGKITICNGCAFCGKIL